MEALRLRGFQFLAIVLLLIALFGVLRRSPGESVTGLALYGTQQDVLGEVEALTRVAEPLRFIGEGANLCLLVNLGIDSYYAYQLQKSETGITITPMREWDCGGKSDFLLKFVGYEEFRQFARQPTCSALRAGGRGNPFWYLPSQLWPKGNSPSCNADFQQKYCAALYYCGEPAELSSALACCSQERMSEQQRELAGLAADSGIVANERAQESAVLQRPLGNIRAILSWGLGMLMIVGLVLGTLALLRKGKVHKAAEGENETIRSLRTYIQDMKRQGFSEAEIAHELRTKGWDEDMIEANLHEGLF